MSEKGALSHPKGADTLDAARLLDHGGRLVVGVDGSEGSMAALRWAVSEAQLRGAAVHMVMAWRHPQSYWPATVWTMMMDSSGDTRQTMANAANTELERLGMEARQGQNAEITWEAMEGHPAEVLVRAAEGAGALVVGSRGSGGFVGVLLGSVSQHVVVHASCPVILIPAPAGESVPAGTVPPAHAHEPFGRIVVRVDGSDGSRAALAWAVNEAQLRGASVHAVIAWERITGPGATNGWAVGTGGPSGDTDPVMATATVEVTRLAKESVKGSDVTISCEAIEGHPAQVLVQCAEGAAALVVGSRGHGGFVGALLGSVSQHVVAHARCPVVLIPDPVHPRHTRPQ
ncbi:MULTISPECIES: universal stress protein [Arthrobacter]|nr:MULTISPECIES: universal stress protein [Arthrobacter]MBT8159540.1 universal stress protein [Arthrobacter sp. GN70]